MIDFHWIAITNMCMVRLYMVIITTVYNGEKGKNSIIETDKNLT